ncbi:MAG TPA: hypothetical protein VG842_03450 [Sediminibacterium sp.]|nr:hypothetical protein [Sediminibacterium sp.]
MSSKYKLFYIGVALIVIFSLTQYFIQLSNSLVKITSISVAATALTFLLYFWVIGIMRKPARA